jgi:prophage DNA circulation protein
MARFSVTFAEAGESVRPAVSADTASLLDNRATAAVAAVEADFAQAFSLAGVPAFVASAAAGLADKAVTLMSSVRGMVPGIPAGVTAFVASAAAVRSNLDSLIREPLSLARGLNGLAASLGNLAESPLGAMALYKKLWEFGGSEPEIGDTTPSRARQAANQAALIGLVRQNAAIEAARSVAGLEFESTAQAQTVREAVTDRLDAEMETAADDAFRALSDLRVAVIENIGSRQNLATVQTWQGADSLPSLVVSHAIYGDIEQAGDIIDRNGVVHPGFIPGGTGLEVLSHV